MKEEMSYLLHVPGLSNCDFHFLTLIHLNSIIKQFVKGDFLFKEGDPASEAYIIREGEFCVLKYLFYIFLKKWMH